MTDRKRASDTNKALLQRFYDEVVNGRNLDLIDELLADDFVEHEKFPGIPPTRDGVKQTFAMFYSAFPDIHFRVDDMVAEGAVVAARVTVTGTHEGEFMGVPATGRSVTVDVMDFVSYRESRGTAHWGVGDMVSLLQQLGVMPPPGG